jgi:hypothetical protein
VPQAGEREGLAQVHPAGGRVDAEDVDLADRVVSMDVVFVRTALVVVVNMRLPAVHLRPVKASEVGPRLGSFCQEETSGVEPRFRHPSM